MAVRKKIRSNKNRAAAMVKMKTIKRLQSKVKDLKLNEKTLQAEKKKIENLKKNVECPVCLDVPRKGPIFACPNGHIICQKCKGGLCPICRVEVGQNKSIVAVALIESILHDCQFNGCGEEYPLDKIETHEKFCDHRIVTCPHYQCEQREHLSRMMLEHLGKSPGCCNSKVPRTILGSSLVEFFTNTNLGYECSWPVSSFSRLGAYFALCSSMCGDYYHFTMVMFESPVVCSTINLEMEVFEKRTSPDTGLSAKLRCNPCSIDEAKSDMKHLGLSVHYKVMENMVVREGSFDFIVRITFL